MSLFTSKNFFKIFPLKVKVNVNSVYSLSRHWRKLGSSTVCANSSLHTYYFLNCLLFEAHSTRRRRTFRNIKLWQKIQSTWEQEAMQEVSLQICRFPSVSIIPTILYIFTVLSNADAICSQQLTASLNNTIKRSTRSHTTQRTEVNAFRKCKR
jgi:hypothetical protein